MPKKPAAGGRPPLTPKLGAFPTPPNEVAAATPYAFQIGAPPNLIYKPATLSTWGNLTYGDCVTAEEAFAKACNNPEIFIPEADVVAWANAHGVLNGAYLTQVMRLMQADGFVQGRNQDDDGPYYAVDWTIPSVLNSAIAVGPVKLGVAHSQLVAPWQARGGRSGWIGLNFTVDQAVDHCISACGYGSLSYLAQQLGVRLPGGVDGRLLGYAVFTWGSIGILDQPSLVAITTEAWLRNPTTVIRPVPRRPTNPPAANMPAAARPSTKSRKTP